MSNSIEALLNRAFEALIAGPHSVLRLRERREAYRCPGLEHRLLLLKQCPPTAKSDYAEGVIQAISLLAEEAGLEPTFWNDLRFKCEGLGCQNVALDSVGDPETPVRIRRVCAECRRSFVRFLNTQAASRKSFWKKSGE